jgi:hypothetical protein
MHYYTVEDKKLCHASFSPIVSSVACELCLLSRTIPLLEALLEALLVFCDVVNIFSTK